MPVCKRHAGETGGDRGYRDDPAPEQQNAGAGAF